MSNMDQDLGKMKIIKESNDSVLDEAVQKLEAMLSEGAKQLLVTLSFFSPHPLSMEILAKNKEAASLPAKDISAFETLIAECVNNSLLEKKEDQLSVNKRVQEVILHQEENWKFCMPALETIGKLLDFEFQPDLSIDPQVLQVKMNITKNVYQLAKFYGSLINSLGFDKAIFAGYDKAEILYCWLIAMGEKIPGLQDSTADACESLAFLYITRDRGEEAEPLMLKVFGSEHPSTASFYSSFASFKCGQDIEEYEEAETYYQKALSIREKVLGPDHLDTATSYYNLAEFYYESMYYEKSKSFHQKALSIREKVLGPNHPDTKGSKYSIKILHDVKKEY